MMQFLQTINEHVPDKDSTEMGERLFIYGLVRALNPKVCVETGTHSGLTALYIAQALYDNKRGKLYTCDPYEWGAKGNFRKFPDLERRINFQIVKGVEFAIPEWDFWFVDGYHEREEVLAELEHFLPFASKRAVILLHDCGGDNISVGVNTAVKEAGLKTVLLPTFNRMRIWSNFKIKDKYEPKK